MRVSLKSNDRHSYNRKEKTQSKEGLKLCIHKAKDIGLPLVIGCWERGMEEKSPRVSRKNKPSQYLDF